MMIQKRSITASYQASRVSVLHCQKSNKFEMQHFAGSSSDKLPPCVLLRNVGDNYIEPQKL